MNHLNSKKQEINLLQNTFDYNKFDLKSMKYEVHLSFKDDENYQVNSLFIFWHKKIFNKLEEFLWNGTKINEIEMIIGGQTVIVNKLFDMKEKLRSRIPPAH